MKEDGFDCYFQRLFSARIVSYNITRSEKLDTQEEELAKKMHIGGFSLTSKDENRNP